MHFMSGGSNCFFAYLKQLRERVCACAVLAIIIRFLVHARLRGQSFKQLQQNEHIKYYENGVHTICSNIKPIQLGRSWKRFVAELKGKLFGHYYGAFIKISYKNHRLRYKRVPYISSRIQIINITHICLYIYD